MQAFQVKKLSEVSKRLFLRLLEGDLPVRDFERCVYNNIDILENELGTEAHLNLISFGYKRAGCFGELKYMIFGYIETKKFKLWPTKKLLIEIIENKIDLVLATRKLKALCYNGCNDFIPVDPGVGYDSKLDDVPIPSEYIEFQRHEVEEKLKKVEWYRNSIIKDARALRSTLNSQDKQNI